MYPGWVESYKHLFLKRIKNKQTTKTGTNQFDSNRNFRLQSAVADKKNDKRVQINEQCNLFQLPRTVYMYSQCFPNFFFVFLLNFSRFSFLLSKIPLFYLNDEK